MDSLSGQEIRACESGKMENENKGMRNDKIKSRGSLGGEETHELRKNRIQYKKSYGSRRMRLKGAS